MHTLSVTKIASIPIVDFYHAETMLREHGLPDASWRQDATTPRPCDITASPKKRMDIICGRRDILKYTAVGAGVMFLGDALYPSQARAFVPLLWALVGAFTVASLAWAVSEPVDGKIALINNSDDTQKGQCLFSCYTGGLGFKKIATMSLEQYRSMKVEYSNDKVFEGAGEYDVDPKSVAVYGYSGLRSPVKTAQLTAIAETSKNFHNISDIAVG